MIFLPAARLDRGRTVRVSTDGQHRIVSRRVSLGHRHYHVVWQPQRARGGDWELVGAFMATYTFREAAKLCEARTEALAHALRSWCKASDGSPSVDAWAYAVRRLLTEDALTPADIREAFTRGIDTKVVDIQRAINHFVNPPPTVRWE